MSMTINGLTALSKLPISVIAIVLGIFFILLFIIIILLFYKPNKEMKNEENKDKFKN